MEISLKKVFEDLSDSLSDSLSFKKQPLIGLDIGQSAVKMAVVEVHGKGYKLHGYASVSLPEAALIEDEIQKKEEIVEAIKNCHQRLKIKAKRVCLGLNGPNTVARKLQLAGGNEDEIEDQVTWEAEQYLPFPVEESAISFHSFGENEGGGVDVLVCASRSETLHSFRQLVEDSGLRVKIVDLGVVALTNVFEEVVGKDIDDDSLDSWIIFDLGAQKTSMVIYKGKKIAFAKEMPIGGVMITEEIQRQMGVNYNEAEDLKTTRDQNGNLPEEILEIIDDVVESFFSEIKKSIDFYVSSTQDEGIVGCYVTGGGTEVPGLVEGLEALLGVNVTILNPFDGIECDNKQISEAVAKQAAAKGVEAIGLAMRKVK